MIFLEFKATTRADSNQTLKGGSRGAGGKLNLAKGAQVALHALASAFTKYKCQTEPL